MGTWEDITVSGITEVDAGEVRRALELFTDPVHAFEIRSLYGLGKAHGEVCKTIDEGVAAAVDQSNGLVTWVVLNPIQTGARSASKKTVTGRRWFLVDVDVIHPEHCSSTDDEKAAGMDVVGRILDYLLELGWPSPVVDDSGNGWHLLYRIDMPNDDLSQQVLKAATASLADRFDSAVARIDRATHDAPRCCKLPGTWVRKDPELPGRPHRMARISWAPDTVEIVTCHQLNELAGGKKAETNGHTPGPSTWNVPVTSGTSRIDAYVRNTIDGECGKVAMAVVSRNIQLNTSAFKLGTMAGWPEMSESYARSRLTHAASVSGLDRDPGCGPAGIAATIQSGWTAGASEPRTRPMTPAATGQVDGRTPPIPAGRRIIWATEVKERKVEWLDPGRIPIGKMTTFAGQTGVGKTMAICDLAARITIGAAIPFGGGKCYQQGKVLVISAEDDADDTIVPRFMAFGGDRSKLALLSPESEDQFSLAALDLLNGCLDDMGPDVRMVAIDPPTSYLGNVDDHKNAELRGLLRPLSNWCRKRRVALIFVTHVNKGGGTQKIAALARVMGSVAWVAAVRSAHMFCKDPAAGSRSLYLPLKVNNAKEQKGLAYKIGSGPDDSVTLEWIEEVSMSADEAMNQPLARKSAGMTAVEWITERFRENVEWRSKDLKDQALDFGLSFNQVFKSPEVNALPIDKRSRIDGSGNTYWVWRSRPGWPPAAKSQPPETKKTSESPKPAT